MLSYSYRKYGNFSADGREFVITRMDTPRPWLNYAWSRHLLADIDQCGAGSSFYRDDDGNRSVPINRRFIYLRDSAFGEFWTVSWGMSVAKRRNTAAVTGLAIRFLNAVIVIGNAVGRSLSEAMMLKSGTWKW